ncbi:MAG: tetratricopeptide (TPR) repeat protein, partial [Kiritimatiellia bacterium]
MQRPDLETALGVYERAVSEVRIVQPRTVLTALLARDDVDSAMGACTPTASAVDRVLTCDRVLRKNSHSIASLTEYSQWRATVTIRTEAWWWRLERARQVRWHDRLDLVLNGATAALLALSASFSISIFQAMSVNGVSWTETLGTLAQGAGLAAIWRGALTAKGRVQFGGALERMGVAPKVHPTVMSVCAAILCGFTYVAHSHVLPDWFVSEGEAAYQLGELNRAEDAFLKARSLAPSRTTVSIELGEVYETTNDLQKAKALYQRGIASGDPWAFNNLGRIELYQGDSVYAETLLRLGLHRVAGDEDVPGGLHDDIENLRYQLNRNLGWALMNQGREHEALSILREAQALDDSFSEGQAGAGMASCLLVVVAEQLREEALRQSSWVICRDHARPETIQEYQWIVSKLPSLA